MASWRRQTCVRTGKPSRIGQPGVRGEGPLEGRVGDEAAGVVDRDDPERIELAAERRDGRGELVRGRRRRQVRHEPGGRLVEDPGRPAVPIAPDLAARRVWGARADARRLERSMAHP